MQKIENRHIRQLDILTPPERLKRDFPLTEKGRQTVGNARDVIENIMAGRDNRLFVICGPCSIHDVQAAKAYATKLYELHEKYQDKLFIAMRVYFEKPRTNVGWKGFLSDPTLDGKNDMNAGLAQSRELLAHFAELGLPSATEALDPVTPQYLADLIAWAAIGARTTESQTHRQMVSGLSMPVGFKNSTDGNLDVAVNAMIAAANPHRFIGIDNSGQAALLHTAGNPHTHIILRGGKVPNYDAESVQACVNTLQEKDLCSQVIVDCSHGNSKKDYRNQPQVLASVIEQRVGGNAHIAGVMLESHLVEGNQREPLTYGQSITDSCIGWAETERVLAETYKVLSS